MSSATHCEIIVLCAMNIVLFELFKTVDLCFIDDILLGPHFVTHVTWAGTIMIMSGFITPSIISDKK